MKLTCEVRQPLPEICDGYRFAFFSLFLFLFPSLPTLLVPLIPTSLSPPIPTPLLIPRLFEFLTTLALRALRRIHIVSTTFQTNTKKGTEKGRCPHAIVNLSRVVKNTTKVFREVSQCRLRCVGCCVVKESRDVASVTFQKKTHICNRR